MEIALLMFKIVEVFDLPAVKYSSLDQRRDLVVKSFGHRRHGKAYKSRV